MLRLIEFYTWAVGLILEIALLLRLSVRIRKTPPAFLLFLFYDILRSLSLFYVNWYALPRYTEWWRIVEVPAVALLAAAGLEAWGELVHYRTPLWMYSGLVAMLFAAGFTIPPAPVPVSMLMIPRTFVVFGIAAGLASAIGYGRGFTIHSGLVLVFCAVDVITHLSIVLGAARFAPETVLTIGQGLCVIAWLVFADKLKRWIPLDDRYPGQLGQPGE